MKLLRLCVVLLASIALSLAQGNDAPSNPELGASPDTTVKPSTETEAPTHSTETEHTTESTPPTKAPTTQHTGTTEAPTTPPAPTTHPSTAVPTTVPPPIPDLGKVGRYVVADHNKTCIILEMAAQFQYKDNNKTFGVNVPDNATAENVTACPEDVQTLLLQWTDEAEVTYTAKFVFDLTNVTEGSDKRPKYSLSNVTFTISSPSIREHLKKEGMAAHEGYTYQCDKKETLAMSEEGLMIWEHVKVQAFMTSNDFSKDVEQCSDDETTNDIVPIAVGCALAGLVIIVLVAYVIGRTVSRKKGYQSV